MKGNPEVCGTGLVGRKGYFILTYINAGLVAMRLCFALRE